ncbi:hypothetical protein K2173_026134 [Erythroxylum novogranatense]|uniref:Remorin C-terminal domain-containing protein n=1 Tax=Erythroxylum novogranatense TaxID=1862640 RepID=A0AAV8TAK9_9ROSI|nr:hypothetical protein K2173_026134 [Erythroxylum novogranatense]
MISVRFGVVQVQVQIQTNKLLHKLKTSTITAGVILRPGTVEKPKSFKETVQPEDNIIGTEDNTQIVDSARSSLSLSVKECQDWRSRSEAFLKKSDRRRPASLDLNNVLAASSPLLGTMKKSLVSSRKSSTFPSPGTPSYQHASVGMQKGCSSERLPSHNNWNRPQVGAALLPFSNDRTLPSKWEDAERWILSPVSGDGVVRTSMPAPQRRPKSKSGPLGPPGIAYYSLYSPARQMFSGGNTGNFVATSPFSAGIIATDGFDIHSNGHGPPFPVRSESCMARSASLHGCSELRAECSLPSKEPKTPAYTFSSGVHGCSDLRAECSLPSQDEKLDVVKDAATNISREASRRDMATQMSPESSNLSSANQRASFSASTTSALPIVEVQSIYSSKSEVRDVQVDDRVTVTRWSKKNRARNTRKSLDIVDDWRKKAADARSSAWDVSEAAKSISKVKREEAKITAWENLQKAKAEAAIRKLEMKLEKKRSSSMDKIMNKLRSAQKRAQEMRSSILTNQAQQISRTSRKAISFRGTRQMASLSGCFTCYAV